MAKEGNSKMLDLLYPVRSIWQEESNQGQRIRRLLSFVRWQFWKRIVGKPIKTKLLNGLQLEVWPDCHVSPSALYYALPNSKHVSFLREHLNGGTFLDVGANIGLVSLLVADRVQHAILFEPSPIAAERARKNLQLNGLAFDIVAEALSDTVGSVEFENGGGANSCNRTVDGFTTSVPTIPVQRTTFDRFLQTYRTDIPAIRWVKIDVEGHENAVLRGMQGFLKNQRPQLVMFEYLARTDIRETLRIFDEVEYFVFELSPSGPRLAAADVTPLQDLFACPNELAAQFGVSEGPP